MNLIYKMFLLVSVISLFTGCAITNPHISADLSASEIGCSPDKIQIQDETATMSGIHNWRAICKGKSYICSYHTTTGAKCSLEQ